MSHSSFPSNRPRIAIVDDEPLACAGLRRKLEALGLIGEIQTFTDPLEALASLRDVPPDLLFLDIRMPGLDGFELLAHFPEAERRFAVVFCTAFHDHATAAFEAAALDYLVKPVDPERLAATLARTQRLSDRALARASGSLERVVARYRGRLEVIPLDTVLALSSEAHRTVAYTLASEHVLESSLTTLEPRLAPARWGRCHRAHLVQYRHVLSVESEALVLIGGRRVPLSRRNRASILERLEQPCQETEP